MNGPLEGYASRIVAELAGQGYAPPSAMLRLRLIAQLSDWLAAEDSCHQDQGPRSYTTPWDTIAYLQRISAAHICSGRTIRSATVCLGLSRLNEVEQH